MATDASNRPGIDSEPEPSTDVEKPGESPLQAARRVWYVWVIGLVALLATVFFATNTGIWSNYAELFYAVFFGIVTLVGFGYGAYSVHDRTRPI